MLPPRLALGTWGSERSCSPVWLAVEQSLSELGICPQWFYSQARPQGNHAAWNGVQFRYLDGWSMSAGQATLMMQEGWVGANLAIVVGRFDATSDDQVASETSQTAESSLTCLADTLSLVKIVVLETSQVFAGDVPTKLGADGVLVTGDSAEQLQQAEAQLQQQFQLPVVGEWLAGEVRWKVPFQQVIAAARDYELEPCRRSTFAPCRARGRWNLRVALALDEAFNGYFPETLTTLQGAGAMFHDFSPLRNDCLPGDVDVVYLGDGPIENWLPQIAANHCFLHRLAAFASRGGKIVAEGRAAVCLCREARPLSGAAIPLSAVLPATAQQSAKETFVPLTVATENTCWLGRQGTTFQGYAPTHWDIASEEPDTGFSGQGRLLMHRNVLALPFAQHWASRPDLIRSFFRARGRRQPNEAFV